MKSLETYLIIAALLMALDGIVTVCFGKEIRITWAGYFPTRELLVFFAAFNATR